MSKTNELIGDKYRVDALLYDPAPVGSVYGVTQASGECDYYGNEVKERKTSKIEWNPDLRAFQLLFKNPLKNGKQSRAFISENDIIDLILAKDEFNAIGVRDLLKKVTKVKKELEEFLGEEKVIEEQKNTWNEKDLV